MSSIAVHDDDDYIVRQISPHAKTGCCAGEINRRLAMYAPYLDGAKEASVGSS